METIRSKPIGGLIQEGRNLRGRGVGGEDFGEERGIISPTGFEEELTGGSALRERSVYISKNVKTIARDGNATGAEVEYLLIQNYCLRTSSLMLSLA